ncbi:hypothetical protein J6590_045565 [Homalodisca vitripennis]|nr:hypothetical protein J6590_092189 [Homalodisca vitripennis]KAG8321499.1 hypothetical protein J6590_045565 [Homalodisca vitripennis]
MNGPLPRRASPTDEVPALMPAARWTRTRSRANTDSRKQCPPLMRLVGLLLRVPLGRRQYGSPSQQRGEFLSPGQGCGRHTLVLIKLHSDHKSS